MRCRTTCLLILLKHYQIDLLLIWISTVFHGPICPLQVMYQFWTSGFITFQNLFIADDKIFYIKNIRNSFYFSINYFFGNTGEEFSFGWKWNSFTALWPFPGWLFFSFSFIRKIAYAQKGSFYKALLLM